MTTNTENFLAVEIKREIAERYFGFRKMIEEDTLDLLEKIDDQLLILEKGISYELIRIYILLRDETLIDQFMELTGWQEKLFYEPYITESPSIRQKVFKDIKIRGFTKFGRFKNLVFDAYERLAARWSCTGKIWRKLKPAGKRSIMKLICSTGKRYRQYYGIPPEYGGNRQPGKHGRHSGSGFG